MKEIHELNDDICAVINKYRSMGASLLACYYIVHSNYNFCIEGENKDSVLEKMLSEYKKESLIDKIIRFIKKILKI